MFTIEQIKEAQSKVESGKDFPKFMKELEQLGVIYFDTYVNDGHSIYFGEDYYSVTSAPMYKPLDIAETPNAEEFLHELKRHQDGRTSFETFCKDCAKTGVFKWVVNMPEKTCTYFTISGQEVYTEEIKGI